jgi:hypothetical protein
MIEKPAGLCHALGRQSSDGPHDGARVWRNRSAQVPSRESRGERVPLDWLRHNLAAIGGGEWREKRGGRVGRVERVDEGRSKNACKRASDGVAQRFVEAPGVE